MKRKSQTLIDIFAFDGLLITQHHWSSTHKSLNSLCTAYNPGEWFGYMSKYNYDLVNWWLWKVIRALPLIKSLTKVSHNTILIKCNITITLLNEGFFLISLQFFNFNILILVMNLWLWKTLRQTIDKAWIRKEELLVDI